MEHRRELLPDRHELPSRFWEPGADEEHDQEPTKLWMDEEPFPFE